MEFAIPGGLIEANRLFQIGILGLGGSSKAAYQPWQRLMRPEPFRSGSGHG